jgi:hypothetical protein
MRPPEKIVVLSLSHTLDQPGERFGCERSREPSDRKKASPRYRKMLDSRRAVDQPRRGAVSQMRKVVFKALTAVSIIGRGSKKRVDWTLAIAIFSTIVTLSLIALYFLQDSGDF